MLLTVSKRVDFSASRRLFSPRLSLQENRSLFGQESTARHGTGRNYVAWFVFSGQPDATTGMLINISEIKERAGSVIDRGYDHRFLNEDNPAFSSVAPTSENIARQLLADVAPLFRDNAAQLTAVHLRETPERSATAYASGTTEANYWFEFSAARRTRSPRLSDAENQNLFGVSVHEHGHNYRARLTLKNEHASPEPLAANMRIISVLDSVRKQLDHKNLSRDVEALRDRPTTTESLARFLLECCRAELSTLARVRLHERDDFFAEAWGDGRMLLGMRESFSAAHRLQVASFSSEQNVELFGKCNNPRGHGHRYLTEATITGEYDRATGALFSFDQMRKAIDDALNPWRDKHLDLETPEFGSRPSTGENIVRALWPKLDAALQQQLVRLRLWETDNNRFTLRRS
ncbi:MAG: 6-carboxytetrahydropterin synthase [Verrucomicrobia bacterium]|nr:6-carboxytetrahydropterin synthase [Verrucomicrobiota bacterium]